MDRCVHVLIGLVLCVGALRGEDKPGQGAGAAKAEKPAAKLDRAALEKQFAETMSGAVLAGSFTIDGRDQPPHKERYTIAKVTKLTGDTWLFNAQIQYGNHDVTLPLPLEVQWAGDTPVITLTDLNIPGLGTFTARVLIYRGRYAGTWQHGAVGGQLFGRIERASGEAPAERKP